MRSLRFAPLALALLAGPAAAAPLSPPLEAELARAGAADALVFFEDAEADGPRVLEDSGRMIPRLHRNMAASRRLLAVSASSI